MCHWRKPFAPKHKHLVATSQNPDPNCLERETASPFANSPNRNGTSTNPKRTSEKEWMDASALWPIQLDLKKMPNSKYKYTWLIQTNCFVIHFFCVDNSVDEVVLWGRVTDRCASISTHQTTSWDFLQLKTWPIPSKRRLWQEQVYHPAKRIYNTETTLYLYNTRMTVHLLGQKNTNQD